MRVIVDPKWTFMEALEAAWDAYSGGQQFGVPNRTRVLEQWANVVGQEKATTELESVISSFDSLDDAVTELGLSKYTIKKLRKSFASMPSANSIALKPKSLYELLKAIPEMELPNELSLLAYALPKLAVFLGYAEAELHLKFLLPGLERLNADAIIIPTDFQRPYIIIEVRKFATLTKQLLENIKYMLSNYLEVSKAQFGVLLSTNFLYIQTENSESYYQFKDLLEDDIITIQQMLARPSFFNEPPETNGIDNVTQDLQALLADVVRAKSNNEKKLSLECLGAAVFEIHPFIRCKFKNLRTASSEIDIVCEYLRNGESAFLDEYGRYFLVECKNWSIPIGAKEIRDFIVKLQKTKTSLGIFFSTEGITGTRDGTDALREIRSCYDREEISIVVLTNVDLASVAELRDVIGLIDSKLDALRFDL